MKNKHKVLAPENNTDELQNLATGSLLLSSKGRVDFSDATMVKERINWFYSVCAQYNMRPGVAGLASALGINRKMLVMVINNNSHIGEYAYLRAMSKESKDLINYAVASLELLWEQYMTQGKINPASGIFLGKNNFGYVDEVQQSIAVASDSFNQMEMKERYLLDVQNEDDDS